jgi:hypothetical protein
MADHERYRWKDNELIKIDKQPEYVCVRFLGKKLHVAAKPENSSGCKRIPEGAPFVTAEGSTHIDWLHFQQKGRSKKVGFEGEPVFTPPPGMVIGYPVQYMRHSFFRGLPPDAKFLYFQNINNEVSLAFSPELLGYTELSPKPDVVFISEV